MTNSSNSNDRADRVPLNLLAAAAARAIQAEAQVVPFFAACGGWGHQRLINVALAIADALPEPERAPFWQATGLQVPDPQGAAAIRTAQARELNPTN